MTTDTINQHAERSLLDNPSSTALASEVLPLHKNRLPSHIPALDGIRGLAVILVLFCHGTQRPYELLGDEIFNTVFNNGLDKAILSLSRICFTGVDLFFVLSGFLITGILFDAKGKSHFFRNFYARRTVRIFPLYYAFLVVTLVIFPHLPAWLSQGFGERPAGDIWYWIYHSNYAQGYYKQIGFPTHHILHVSWSLAIEEQFYLAWPLVVFCCTRKTLVRVCMGMFTFSMLFRIAMFMAGSSALATSFTFGKLDGLAAGAFIALVARGPEGVRGLVKPAWIVGPLAAAAIAGMVVAMQKLGYRTGIGQTPGYIMFGGTLFALLYGALIALTVAAARGALLEKAFSNPFMRMFGKYSYAIYLFHLPIMVWVAEWWFRPDSIRMGRTLLPGLVLYHLVTTSLSVAAAWLSWNLMEKHFLKLKDYFPSGAHSEPKLQPAVLTAP